MAASWTDGTSEGEGTGRSQEALGGGALPARVFSAGPKDPLLPVGGVWRSEPSVEKVANNSLRFQSRACSRPTRSISNSRGHPRIGALACSFVCLSVRSRE